MRGRARAASTTCSRSARVGGQRDRDRRGHRHGPAAGVRRRRAGRRPAGDRARRRVPGLRPRARSSRAGRSTRRPSAVLDGDRPPARPCSRCSAAPTSPRAAGRSSSTTASSARARCGGPSRPTPRCSSCSSTARAIAVSIDGNGRRVAGDPYRGAVEAVLECSANLACVGAEPLGLTNCLNFGNPEKPHIAWQLTRAVAGLGDACRALGVPVVGGNVSLYNEGGDGPIYPTPVVGMVGELPDAARAGRLGFARRGRRDRADRRVVGAERGRLRAGQAARRAAAEGALPVVELGEVKALHAAVRQAVRSGALRSAHDVAEGGVAVALAECCIAGGIGAHVDARRRAAVRRGPGRVRRLRPGRGDDRVRRRGARDRRGRRRGARHPRRARHPGRSSSPASHGDGLAALVA